jgi:hypothetical protein
MRSDGSYTRTSGEDGLDSQAWFLGQRGCRPGAVGCAREADAVLSPESVAATPPRPACFLVEGTGRMQTDLVITPGSAVQAKLEASVNDGQTVLAKLASRVASDLAVHFVNAAEEIRRRAVYEAERSDRI